MNVSKIIDAVRMSNAADQSRAIAQGDIDLQSLVACECAAIDELNPQLNAFVQRVSPANHDAHALNEARSLLSGSSFAAKDNFDVIGLPTHAGLLALHATPATNDAIVVARLKQAGLRFTGKLNMSPVALGASTHNTDFGDCFNPHRAGFSAGGSSGGSASAVAAGLVGIALGSDTMGSVRLPAALCGVVGFKPSWGRLPVDGLMPLCVMLDHVGVLSRSVEDAALAFSIMSSDPSRATVRGPANDFKRLGVPQSTAAMQLSSEVETSFAIACEQLSANGFTLKPVDMSGLNLSAVRRAGLVLCEAELLSTLEAVYPDQKHQLPNDLVKHLEFIENQSVKKLGQALSKLAASRFKFESWFNGIDALMLPTCAHTAFPMTGSVPADIADLTVVANVMGAPAINLPLPLPVPADGLPTGLQLVGRYGTDEELLALSSIVELLLKGSMQIE